MKNREKWEARFQRVLSGSCKGDWATRNCKRILAAELRKLAHGKCVYCETALEVSTYIEIEHYVARTTDVSLAFEWTNLLPACRLCNGAKGGQDHGGALLKPDEEDPEPYFWLQAATGELLPHPNLSADLRRRAEETIRLCDLQRGELCTQRTDMREIADLLLQLLSDGSSSTRMIQRAWKALSDPRREYKLVVRHVLTLKGRHDLAAEDRHLFLTVE